MTDTRLLRQVADALLRARGRRHLAALDRLRPERSQTRILLGLLHQARSTPFGRDHGFARIRTAADFRRLVPVQTFDELWQEWGRLDEITWPGLADQLLPYETGDGLSRRYLPLSPALEAAHRAANQTALALVHRARPQAGFCTGALVFLGEALAADRLAEGKCDGEAALNLRQLPWPTRHYALAEPTTSARAAVTCLAGSMPSLLQLLAEVKNSAQRDRLTDVWPSLTAVLWSRKPSDPPAALLREEVGAGVVLLEMASRFGSPIAVEDPETGLLRWLPDHGVYFEFIPAEEVNKPQPERYSFDRVVPGAEYELVLTSPAGLWACRTGEMIRFERRDPPLFCFSGVRIAPAVQSAKCEVRSERTNETDTSHGAHGTSHVTKGPHRRSAGTPVAPQETFGHNLWSTPADRG